MNRILAIEPDADRGARFGQLLRESLNRNSSSPRQLTPPHGDDPEPARSDPDSMLLRPTTSRISWHIFERRRPCVTCRS